MGVQHAQDDVDDQKQDDCDALEGAGSSILVVGRVAKVDATNYCKYDADSGEEVGKPEDFWRYTPMVWDVLVTMKKDELVNLECKD